MVAIWHLAGLYPGEPVFVPTPSPTAEDDGVLLSVVLDLDKDRSFLLVLDAASLNELARAAAPHAIPFHFHGNYFAGSN
jgi:carotenoid cleavage dioxygenase-like enzyme